MNGRTSLARSAALALLTTLASVELAAAQQSAWQIDLGVSAQFTTLAGDITFDDIDDPRTLSLSDLTSSAQPGFAIEFDLWRGDWGLLTDLLLVDYEGKAATEENAIFTTQAQETVGRIALGRRIVPGAHVYAGARIWSTALAFRAGEPSPGYLDGSDSWADPVVGGSIDTPVGDDGWFATLDADVGGFGVSSKLTWEAVGTFGYEVSPGWSVLMRYRLTGVDYETTSSAGGGTVTYDTVRHGPFFGVVFHF